MTSNPTVLPLDRLTVDPALQMRVQIDTAAVADYAQRMQAGDTFPPIRCFQDSTTAEIYLADGFHRVAARRQAGFSDIAAEIVPGDRRQALLYAIGANGRHGVRRTRADLRRTVLTLLRDPEWRQWSDRHIAEHCRTDHRTVGRLRALCGEIPQMDRKAERNGSVYTVKVRDVAPITSSTEQATATRVVEPETHAEQSHTGTPPSPPPACAAAVARWQASTLAAHLAVQPGQWWHLGPHRIFCGDANDARFLVALPPAELGFCDLRTAQARQYGWNYHPVTLRATVFGIALARKNLFTFPCQARLPYRETVACVLNGGGAQDAEGWFPFLLCSPAELASPLQVVHLTATRGSDANTPPGSAELALRAIQAFTAPQGVLVDPLLGGGSALLAAELTGRTCWGAQPDPEVCATLLARWEAFTGARAVPSTGS